MVGWVFVVSSAPLEIAFSCLPCPKISVCVVGLNADDPPAMIYSRLIRRTRLGQPNGPGPRNPRGERGGEGQSLFPTPSRCSAHRPLHGSNYCLLAVLLLVFSSYSVLRSFHSIADKGTQGLLNYNCSTYTFRSAIHLVQQYR